MLKGIDSLLSPDLLHVLAAMGHGDELALVDRNYPAVATARRLVRVDGADLPTTARAILTLLPIDDFIDTPITVMRPVHSDDRTMPAVQREVVDAVEQAEQRSVAVQHVERAAFYARAREAFAVVATSESRPYGCVILTKGVIR